MSNKVKKIQIGVCANMLPSLRVCKRTIGFLFFYVLLCYSLLFSSEIILKQLFASGSVNTVEQSPALCL